MALNSEYSHTASNAMVNALAALCNGGTINVYSGTQPANANTALSGNTLLVTLTFGSTAFANAVNGVANANAITSGTAVATGTASFARIIKSDLTTVVMDGTVGTASCNVNLSTVSIVNGGVVQLTSMTATVNEAGT